MEFRPSLKGARDLDVVGCRVPGCFGGSAIKLDMFLRVVECHRGSSSVVLRMDMT